MRESATRYGVTVAVVAVAAIVRRLLDPILGDSPPFPTYFIAVIFSAWYAGLRPAILATLLGFIVPSFVFASPQFAVLEGTAPQLLASVMYFVVCSAIIAFSEAMRIAQRRATQSEQFARQQAETLRITFASIGDAVLTTDARGRIAFLNPVGEALTGWKLVEAVGQPLEAVFNIVNEQTRERAENPVAKVLHDGKIVGLANHTLLIAKDGIERAIDDSAAPICDAAGTIVGVVMIFRDVTEQRKAEARERQLLAHMAATNAKFRAFFEQGALFSGIMDINGTLLETNRLAVDACGYTKEQVVGRPFWECPWWAPSAPIVDRIREACGIAAAGEMFRAEMPYFVADGTQRLADLIISPVRDDSGRVAFLAPTGNDITDQKRMEGELRRSATELAETERRKDEFLAMLGHELRNPLAGIVTGAQVLELLQLGGDAGEMASVIGRQAAHMSHMVDDLLDVSRIARGKLALRLAPVEMVELLETVVRDYRKSHSLEEWQVRFAGSGREAWVQGDRTRLAQVVTNLLHNGCKFCDGPPNVTVSLETFRETATFDIIVRDQGIGMSPETIARIFEPFAQADNSLDRSRGGLGLGLALVKGVTELHQGSVRAASAGLGKGTEFRLTLPLSPHPAQVASDQAESCPVQVAATLPRHVLLIDDRRDAIWPVQKFLEMEGHRVSTACDGPSGLGKARECRPDVVLCDIGLAGSMNGYEVAMALGALGHRQAMYVVAVTGYGQDEDRRKAQSAGFDYHLTKPVSREQLNDILSRMPHFEA